MESRPLFALVALPRTNRERAAASDVHIDLVPSLARDAARGVAQDVAASKVREDTLEALDGVVQTMDEAARAPHRVEQLLWLARHAAMRSADCRRDRRCSTRTPPRTVPPWLMPPVGASGGEAVTTACSIASAWLASAANFSPPRMLRVSKPSVNKAMRCRRSGATGQASAWNRPSNSAVFRHR